MIVSRGSGLLRQEWYSICSQHHEPKDGCPRCKTGEWKYVVLVEASQALYHVSPRLWRIWANRPFMNPSRKFLKRAFPGLR